MAVYDQYYQQKHYFGEPYPELLTYAAKLDKNLKVLDLGCGQGRDAIALARMGFSVTAVDISEVGIKQMNQVAKDEGLDINALVMDLNHFDALHDFDIILLDSMFHFYKKDIDKETHLLNRFIQEAKSGAQIILIVQYGRKRIDIIKQMIGSRQEKCQVIHEQKFIYQAFNSPFYMLVFSKKE